MKHEWFEMLSSVITKRHIFNLASAAMIMTVGLYIAKRASEAVGNFPKFDSQQRLIFKKFSYYGLATLVLTAALNQLGFELKVILGAAGVLTVAVGFAAQTSASNLISGLFLMVDRPFVIGDVIAVDAFRGEIVSIDLLSCRLRTLDNLLVRIPNETMVKSSITNLSHYPIRRIDLKFGVAYKEDLSSVQRVLNRLAAENPLCLDEPRPLFLVLGFGESSVDLQFSVWTATQNVVETQNSIYDDIKRAFETESIELPYPHRVILGHAKA